jgi:hypothetical protein
MVGDIVDGAGAAATGRRRRKRRRSRVSMSLSSPPSPSFLDLSSSSVGWEPRARPLSESEPQHVIVDDDFAHAFHESESAGAAEGEERAAAAAATTTTTTTLVGKGERGWGRLLRRLRGRFDTVHAKEAARRATSRNFQWEFWNADNGQYKMLRTPAATFFGPMPLPSAAAEGEGGEGVGDAAGEAMLEGEDKEAAEAAEDLFGPLCELLTTFGQRQLGMNAITPPWLSCYVDGSEQRLHTDPAQGTCVFTTQHGPMDFFSSTNI